MPDPLTATELNQITSVIVTGAIKIHRRFGSGLLENAYLACLCRELQLAGLVFETQKPLPLIYEGVQVTHAYRADLLVAQAVIVEVKAIDTVTPMHLRQVRTYLELADCRVGLLLNFGAALMRTGIHRVVNRFPDQ